MKISHNRIRQLIGSAVFVVLVFVVSLLLTISFPYGQFVATIVATTVGFLGYRIAEKALDFIFGKEESIPILELQPLPHFEGIPLPPKVEHEEQGAKFTNMGATSPYLEHGWPSQRILVYWHEEGKLFEKPKEFMAKFGVIRLFADSGDAIGCRAEARYQLVEDVTGVKGASDWTAAGLLNWYSKSNWANIATNQAILDELDRSRGSGINKYLVNTSEDIHQGEQRDLELFYMIKDSPFVILCTDVTYTVIGSGYGDKPVTFKVEISVSAQKYPKQTWSYLVTAKWDDYKVQRI